MTATSQQDTGLMQRGLLLLGGMTALGVVVMLIVLRGPDSPTRDAAKAEPLLVPMFTPNAPYPATLTWLSLAQLGEQMPSAPGWQVRYNAAIALARRGSQNTPWPLLREMLDEQRQRRNFRILVKGGKSVANEEEAQHAVRNALAAVAQWHKKQDAAAVGTVSADLQKVYDAVDRLAQGGNNVLRVQADRTRQLFFRKS